MTKIKENGRNHFRWIVASELMSRIKSKSNKTTEIRMVALLRKHGITAGGARPTSWQARFHLATASCRRVCRRLLLAWASVRQKLDPEDSLGVFGCEVAANRRRDAKIRRGLRRCGWSVIRVWECSLAGSLQPA